MQCFMKGLMKNMKSQNRISVRKCRDWAQKKNNNPFSKMEDMVCFEIQRGSEGLRKAIKLEVMSAKATGLYLFSINLSLKVGGISWMDGLN